MHCGRCAGLMVIHPLSDRDSRHTHAQWRPPQVMWRCLICGDRVDSVVILHRTFSQAESVFERRERVWRTMRTA